MALGADYVFLGRPAVYAMTYEGSKGIISLFNLLSEELKIAMKLCGFNSIAEINDEIIVDHTLPPMHLPRNLRPKIWFYLLLLRFLKL